MSQRDEVRDEVVEVRQFVRTQMFAVDSRYDPRSYYARDKIRRG